MSDASLSRLEAIIDASGASEQIEALLPLGVRPRQLSVRTLLIGILIALKDARPAHLKRIHGALVHLSEAEKRRLGVIVQWKSGPHELTYRQIERTFHLVAQALSKEEPPDGKPSQLLSEVVGYPSNRTRLGGSPVFKPEITTRARWGSSTPGFEPMRTVWTRADADCLDYLEWLRWREGFVCPGCGHGGGWRIADGRFKCSSCGERTSVTAGTIFDRTRTPLTVWFSACWMFASQKDGVSALSLKRALEIGSYQTAWAMLHRLRSVLVRPGRERLSGEVEVDETYIGGEEPGRPGRPGRDSKKVLVGVAVEREQPKGFGRCRMVPITDASVESLRRFLVENVEPGARVITDGWGSYPGATKDLYVHEPLQGASGVHASSLLPGVHKVSSLAKRWLLGTHQGSVEQAHLSAYLNEFVFRFNRRRSRSRGLVFYRVLELAVAHDPVRYRELIANPKPGRQRRPPPSTRGRPPSLERPPAGRPWRSG